MRSLLLYDVSVPAINQHLKRIFGDQELAREATIKKYLIVQTEGKRQVQREVDHYSLQAIIAVGFKIENERAVQFRKWANQIVKDYTIQGWTMDVERLKNGGNLTDAFFERQLEKIREIRLSERKFYQKITDIYATSLDYDASATATQRFFAAVQNMPVFQDWVRFAQYVCSHNIVAHDLPQLKQLHGPEDYAGKVIDTLYLSPIAYPSRPYHHLTKEDKLIRESRNDPVQDSRSCQQLLKDCCEQFAKLKPGEI